MKGKKSIDLFQSVVNISSIVALFLQCVEIPEPWNAYIPYVAYVAIVFSIVSVIFSFAYKNKTIFRRSALIKITKKRMINSTGKIVMFGGDLSWAEDYIDVIQKVTNDGKVVEIIFPLEKVINAKKRVMNEFDKRVGQLRNAGASIYYVNDEHYLRCTLIDVDPGRENEDLCVISSKRIYTHTFDQEKTKYHTRILENSNDEDRTLCNSFYRNYCLIVNNRNEY